MGATKAVVIAGIVTFSILFMVGSFNFYVDPMCYFHCEKIDVRRHTINLYYQVAQKILAHPEATVVVVGSSRGQTTPLTWLERKTGAQVLNLSIGGAEFTAKLAFLNIALQHNKIKEVIWYSDYFELIPDVADSKIRSTPALQIYLEKENRLPALEAVLNHVRKLIDHNTLEASFYSFKSATGTKLDKGSGSQLDADACASDTYKGETSAKAMEKISGVTYAMYSSKVLQPPQSADAWDSFLKKMSELSQAGINVVILVPPYNPSFAKRLAAEFPEIYSRHLTWIEKLKSIRLPHVTVLDYFQGIPHDDATQRYWNDGVHFTCKGAIQMLDGHI